MAKRKRRTEEELIADLEAEIKRLRQRAQEKKTKASPDGRAFLEATKALDKAIRVVTNVDLLNALEAARTPLSAEMVKQGLRLPKSGSTKAVSSQALSRNNTPKRKRRSAEELEELRVSVRSFVEKNPGKRLGEIATALSMATKDVRRPTLDLLDSGDLRSEGERGGTKYFPRRRRR